jgi:DNA-binding transcriptional ArsR family regulator
MSQNSKLKVQIEHDGFKHTIEGEPDKVLKAISQYIAEIYPAYDLASKLIYSPDYLELLEEVSVFVNLTTDGQPIMLRSDLSADQALAAILLANQVAFKLGKRTTDESAIEEISRAIGKAQKTVQNTLTDMTKAGIVERSGKGSYRLTTTGTREVQETLNSLREGRNGNAGERVEPSS